MGRIAACERTLIPDGDALAVVLRAFKFVEQRDGVILERNLAYAVRVVEDVIFADAEFSCSLTRRDRHGRSDEHPIEFRFLLEQIIELARAANAGLESLVRGREVGRVNELDVQRASSNWLRRPRRGTV